MPSSPAPLPTWWLRVWITIGVGVFVLLILVPAFIFTTFTSERHRFQDCEKKLRNDCRPSMIWLFAGWLPPVVQTPTSTADTLGSVGTQVSSTASIPPVATSTVLFGAGHEERTSETAPRITSIKAEGALLEQGVYRVQATTTSWTIKATGAQTVELYLKTSGAVGAASKRVLTLKKQKDGSFQASWKVPAVLGELEVRATGAKNSRHSLFFAVASTR